MLSASKQIVKTYKSLNNWHAFQIKLFAEGILVGIFAGLAISLFRFLLNTAESGRVVLYNYIAAHGYGWMALWFVFLLILAGVLTWLSCHEPMAGGSGIPQVKAVIMGL
jgi:H+/Cl- antiporter ClcA